MLLEALLQLSEYWVFSLCYIGGGLMLKVWEQWIIIVKLQEVQNVYIFLCFVLIVTFYTITEY